MFGLKKPLPSFEGRVEDDGRGDPDRYMSLPEETEGEPRLLPSIRVMTRWATAPVAVGPGP